MASIIVKSYEHFNKSLPNWDTPKGKYIKNKEHYESELRKSGMVHVDNAGQTSKPKLKDYKLSDKARSIISSASNSKDKHGNVRLSDRTIDALKEIGAIGNKIPSYMGKPDGKGGFYK